MIELYTAATPNGWKISILLEELGIEYEVLPINLMKDEQKSEEFLKLNPNGKIPVIKDRQNDRVIFESGAILMYLAEKHNLFFGDNQEERYSIIQWLMFQVGGIGPMMGQANVFYRYFPEKIPAVIARYHTEVKRLFSVLDKQLEKQDYLTGDKYTIADIANWSWVHVAFWGGVKLDGYDNLTQWCNRIALRPAVQKGINIPPKADPEAIKKAGKKLIS